MWYASSWLARKGLPLRRALAMSAMATARWALALCVIGTGRQVITASVPNEMVASDITFGGMGTSKAVFHLQPRDQATLVRWTLDSDMGAGPVGRYFGLFMDKMVGKDYQRGLEQLKALLETMPDEHVGGPAT